MNSAFNWRGQSSQIAQSLKPSPMARKQSDLAPKVFHIYAQTAPAHASLEAQITQVGREVEFHFANAQTVTCDLMRGHHRDEARRLAAKVKALMQSRSADYVASLEAERGLI